MATVANRRSVMTLFCQEAGAQSHRVRFVLAEKGIATVDMVEIKPDETDEELVELNPYNSVPTLVDRELVLYDPRIIIEYIDERFPHPPLMPVDPVSRARFRLALFRIEEDFYTLIEDLEHGTRTQKRKAKKELTDGLVNGVEVFAAYKFFLSEEFSLVDCTMAPILWRLEKYKIDLPPKAKPIKDYAERLFAREGFRNSLTQLEREMRS